MDVLGVVLVLVFYAVILVFGIWIARRKGVLHPEQTSDLILAGRNIGLVVGIFTLVATEVGGAFVNGTAEEVFNRGAIWCLAPIGYSVSMTINGLFFVHKLRDKKYLTLIDALQSAYGQTMGGLVYLPSCVGDICWTAAVLVALGSTLSILLNVNQTVMIVISTMIAVAYTLIGGLYSVALTDVVQLVFIAMGLCVALPFMVQNDRVTLNDLSTRDWTGEVTSSTWVSFLDTVILILCGGIPWQPYYQRALSLRTNTQAKFLSVAATVLCLVCMVPPVVIGAVAKSVDWSADHPEIANDTSVVLPVAVKELTPHWVALLALAAVSAAAMSSVDSALLGSASYLTHNIYSSLVRGQAASKSELIKVFRLMVIVLGLLALGLSVSTSTVYGLWVLAGDLGFVVVFPQFLLAVHAPEHVCVVGSMCGAGVGIVLRALVGEPTVGLPAAIQFPEFPDGSPKVPVKTAIMVGSMAAILIGSAVRRRVSRYSNVV